MNPQELDAATIAPKRRPFVENVSLVISDIQIGEGKPSFFVGKRFDTGEEMQIRLMTVAEAVEANLRKDSDEGDKLRLTNYYTEKFSSGTHVRPTATKFADPEAKEHVEPGGVVMFERVIKNDDGTYRAQWASTIAPTAEDEAMIAMVHLDGWEENPANKQKASVRATVLNPDKAIVLAGDNRLEVLHALLANTNSRGQPRAPAPMLRITAEDGTPYHAVVPPISVKETKKDFDSGLDKQISRILPAGEAIAAILADTDNKSHGRRLAKAVLSGLTGQSANWAGVPAEAIPTLNNISASVASGKSPVVAIPGERIYAGNVAAKKMMASPKNAPIGRLINNIEAVNKKVNGVDVDFTVPLYTNVFLGIQRHKDTKAPFLRDIHPTSPYPKHMKLADLQLGDGAKLAAAPVPLEASAPEALSQEFSDQDLNASLAAATDIDEQEMEFSY